MNSFDCDDSIVDGMRNAEWPMMWWEQETGSGNDSYNANTVSTEK